MYKEKNTYDYIIIGGGPAGIQMAYFLQKQKRFSYIVLEQSSQVGNFFAKFPRHNKLISINKVYTGYQDYEINLRWDWNSLLNDDTDESVLFKKYTKKFFPDRDKLLEYLDDFKEQYNLNVQLNSQVQLVSKESDHFKVDLANKKFLLSKYLLVGTGLHQPFIPDIKGIDETENYVDFSTDPNEFENKKVLIIGKGNSAFETADSLVGHAALIHLISPNPLKMAWRTHYVGHLRAVNNNFLDTYQLKSQNAVIDGHLSEIKKTPDGYSVTISYQKADNEVEVRNYDKIICCAGFKFDSSIYDAQCKPTLCNNDKFPLQNNDWESNNVKNMYFIGTLTQALDYKKYMSGFIHGFRYNIHSLFDILMHKNHQEPFKEIEKIQFNAKTSAELILKLINKTSALWQQPGFLGHPIKINQHDKTLVLYDYLPVDFIKNNLFSNEKYLIITLEFGQDKPIDPFNAPRPKRDNYNHAHESLFLHPIIRIFDGAKLKSSHHVIEDFDAVWNEKEHYIPLTNYLEKSLFTSSEDCYS